VEPAALGRVFSWLKSEACPGETLNYQAGLPQTNGAAQRNTRPRAAGSTFSWICFNDAYEF